MFSPDDRKLVREWLIELARSDPRVTGVALVGSAAEGREDKWSDIDVALRLGADVDAPSLADGWSASISQRFDVVDQLDVWSDLTLFRVFLLSDTLQIDVSFWPGSRFAASGGAFHVVFGQANPAVPDSPFDAGTAIRMGWLYALHVRSSLARDRRWQAIHMINGMRERVLELTCARHGLPTRHGRGLDDLPETESRVLVGTLVTSPHDEQLYQAFELLADALLAEAQHAELRLAKRLTDPLRELVRTGRSEPGR